MITGNLESAINGFAEEIAALTGQLGKKVSIDKPRLLDRSDSVDLAGPGEWSANRTCRLLPAADGWVAVNLPRPEDRELIPAWIGAEVSADIWSSVVEAVRVTSRAELLAQAHMLGLAVAGVGEIGTAARAVVAHTMARPETVIARKRLRVIDMSSLWAGPLCGGIFAEMGATVLKVESRRRLDTSREFAPALFQRLNGRKSHAVLDFDDTTHLRLLSAQVAAADVLITSARPRAFEALQLAPQNVFARNPRLVWVAITAYGWTGASANRIGFGDDAAAAGGLLDWNSCGQPRFVGDALADPLTGLAAAGAALQAVAAGGGTLLDAALARTAASVAA